MKRPALLLLLCVIGLNGCADSLNRLAYHQDIPQGNILAPEQIKKLKVGMDQSEVVQTIGSPLLTDPFHPNRWDYVQRTTSTADETTQIHLTLIFDKEGKLKSWRE